MSVVWSIASNPFVRSRRVSPPRRRWMVLGLAGLTGVTLLMPSCTAPAHAQAVRMQQKFRFVGGTVTENGRRRQVQTANDFHLETSLFILRQPRPTSDVFSQVTVREASGAADFERGQMQIGDEHMVDWTAAGRNSRVTSHYFTLDGNEIDNSSWIVSLTNDFDFNPFGGGGGIVTVATSNDSGRRLAGGFALYAKPIIDFGLDNWADLTDGRPLLGLTPYALDNGDSMPLNTFSLPEDQYILVVGTADDGSSTSTGPATFKTAFSARLPEPETLSLLAFGVLGIGLRRRWRPVVLRRGILAPDCRRGNRHILSYSA